MLHLAPLDPREREAAEGQAAGRRGAAARGRREPGARQGRRRPGGARPRAGGAAAPEGLQRAAGARAGQERRNRRPQGRRGRPLPGRGGRVRGRRREGRAPRRGGRRGRRAPARSRCARRSTAGCCGCSSRASASSPAGTPILEVGDASRLEIVIEVLSTDAVRVRPGMPVNLAGWGGEGTLPATVRTVEPAAFTKVSALGVEEQRVRVIADLAGPPGPLGDGYRVEARIVTWSADSVLKVPASAVFRRAAGAAGPPGGVAAGGGPGVGGLHGGGGPRAPAAGGARPPHRGRGRDPRGDRGGRARRAAPAERTARRRARLDPMKRAVVVRFSSLGDVVLTLPVARSLKEAFPAAEIVYLTKAAYRPLLEGQAGIDRVVTLEEAGPGLEALRRSLPRARPFRPRAGPAPHAAQPRLPAGVGRRPAPLLPQGRPDAASLGRGVDARAHGGRAAARDRPLPRAAAPVRRRAGAPGAGSCSSRPGACRRSATCWSPPASATRIASRSSSRARGGRTSAGRRRRSPRSPPGCATRRRSSR